jgi:hypothetical protein
MNEDIINSWRKLLKNCTYIADSDGVHVSFPQKLFNEFEQEFNIFFTDPEEDVLFQQWKNSNNEGEDYEGRF